MMERSAGVSTPSEPVCLTLSTLGGETLSLLPVVCKRNIFFNTFFILDNNLSCINYLVRILYSCSIESNSVLYQDNVYNLCTLLLLLSWAPFRQEIVRSTMPQPHGLEGGG